MTAIRIELSEATAHAAHEAGLLTPQALDRLLIEALAHRLSLPSAEPAPAESCSAARLDAVRSEQRRRTGGH